MNSKAMDWVGEPPNVLPDREKYLSIKTEIPYASQACLL